MARTRRIAQANFGAQRHVALSKTHGMYNEVDGEPFWMGSFVDLQGGHFYICREKR